MPGEAPPEGFVFQAVESDTGAQYWRAPDDEVRADLKERAATLPSPDPEVVSAEPAKPTRGRKKTK